MLLYKHHICCLVHAAAHNQYAHAPFCEGLLSIRPDCCIVPLVLEGLRVSVVSSIF